MDECVESVQAVLEKRETQNAIITGIELDRLAEQKKLSEPLQSIMTRDEALFGIDEIPRFIHCEFIRIYWIYELWLY